MPSSAHHYHFTHTALRQLAFSTPRELLDALDSPRCEGLFGRLLHRIDCELWEGDSRTFGSSDIKVSSLLLKERPCAILQMPEPEQTGEAYFVAIWSRYDQGTFVQKAIAKNPADQPLIDYFTLERASGLTRKCHQSAPQSQSPTCFCSWSHKGEHRNHGTGPVPSFDQFVKFLGGFRLREPDDDFPPTGGAWGPTN